MGSGSLSRHKKYQPDRPDILWNTDWGIPFDAITQEEAKGKGLVAFNERWVYPEQEDVLKKQYGVYRNLRIVAVLAGLMGMLVLISGFVAFAAVDTTGLLVCVLAGGAILGSGIGLYCFRPWGRYCAGFLQIVLFVLGIGAVCGYVSAYSSFSNADERLAGAILMTLGIVLIYTARYLAKEAVQQVLRKPVSDTQVECPQELLRDICQGILSAHDLIRKYGISTPVLKRQCKDFISAQQITESDYIRITGEPFVLR